MNVVSNSEILLCGPFPTTVLWKKFFRLYKYKSSNMKFNTFHLAYKSILLLGTRDTKSENSISNIRFVFDTFYFC